MTSRGLIACKKVMKMLRKCAPGFEVRWKEHHLWITYQGRTDRAFPRGPNRNSYQYEVERGHVRRLVHRFAIEDCARRHLPQLR